MSLITSLFSGNIFAENFLFPIGVAFCTYYTIGFNDELKKRQNYSKLGEIVIDSFLEEVKTGLSILKSIIELDTAITNNPITIYSLPNKSYSGINTISDDVMLRIIAISYNKKFEGFHPKDIRIHIKNYFEHICNNTNNEIKKVPLNVDNLKKYITSTEYIKSTESVLHLLIETKNLLNKNGKRLLPK